MSEFTIVGRYPTLALAQLAQAALEAEGIASFFENAEIVNAEWLIGIAVGDVKLLVPTSDFGRALTILADFDIRKEVQTENEDTSDRCLSCGANFPVDSIVCNECGWTFQVEDDSTPEVSASSINNGDPATGILTSISHHSRPLMNAILFYFLFPLWMLIGGAIVTFLLDMLP